MMRVRRKWQPTPVFLPGEFYGQRSLVGSSPWGCKESDTTERLALTHSWCMCVWVLSHFSQTLCDSMEPSRLLCQRILQARLLEKVALSSFWGSSLPRDRTHVSYFSCFEGQIAYHKQHLGSPDYVVVQFLFFWGIAILFSIVAAKMHIPSNSVRVVPFCTSLLVTGCLFDRCEVISHCGFDLHFPDN